MRVIEYPDNARFDSAYYDDGELWILTVPRTPGTTALRNRRRLIVTDGWVSDITLPTGLMWRHGSMGHYSFVRRPGGALAVVPGLEAYTDTESDQVVELRTGTTHRLIGDETRLGNTALKADAYDDQWVLMNAGVALSLGEFLTGPTAFEAIRRYADVGNESRSGLLFVHRRGGDTRMFDLRKTVGQVLGVALSPDGCTAVAVGNKAAVVIDLE